MVVLSGMSDMAQLLDNTSYMMNFQPLIEEENALVHRAATLINASIAVPCTGCSYCTEGCPRRIPIPRFFSLYNEDMREAKSKGWSANGIYYEQLAKAFAKASDCIACGQCEGVCPQHIPIIAHLKEVAGHFEQ